MSSAKDAKKSDNIIRFWSILNNCHVISKIPAVDTEVDPPKQFSPANDDDSILSHCKKPCVSARDHSICSLSLPNDRCAQ